MARSRVHRILGLILVAVVACSWATVASLRVADFLAELEIRPPSILGVTETLTVDFASAHHGIFREIKVSERLPSGERAAIRASVRAVTLDGAPVPYDLQRSGDTLVLKIGDAQRTVIGRHMYRISYDVERAFIFSEESVQLYWNVTGNDWPIPIDHASAVVSLPEGVEAYQALRQRCVAVRLRVCRSTNRGTRLGVSRSAPAPPANGPRGSLAPHRTRPRGASVPADPAPWRDR